MNDVSTCEPWRQTKSIIWHIWILVSTPSSSFNSDNQMVTYLKCIMSKTMILLSCFQIKPSFLLYLNSTTELSSAKVFRLLFTFQWIKKTKWMKLKFMLENFNTYPSTGTRPLDHRNLIHISRLTYSTVIFVWKHRNSFFTHN